MSVGVTTDQKQTNYFFPKAFKLRNTKRMKVTASTNGSFNETPGFSITESKFV